MKIGELTIGRGRKGAGGGAPFFILGPCVMEDEATTLKTLEALKETTSALGVPFIFKSSYDKANRTSIESFRGPGLKEGLKLLGRCKEEFGVPVLTDVHCTRDVSAVAEVADVIQIPAFLCRQTDLLVAAGSTGRAVNIKKGQFSSPEAIIHSVRKVESGGCADIILTERGVSFGYGDLVVDYRAIPVMKRSGYPVVFDATHSVQSPSGLGASSGGDRAMARYLARAAAAVGVDGFFMEVHPDPERALCDGPNSIALKDVRGIMEDVLAVDAALKARGAL